MDFPSLLLGLLASLWGLSEIIYPRESLWFFKKWLEHIEKRLLTVSLTLILSGSILLLIVWWTNQFLSLLVVGSFLLYTGFKYLLFGNKVVEFSRKSFDLPDYRHQIMGVWLLLGGLGLVYLSVWF